MNEVITQWLMPLVKREAGCLVAPGLAQLHEEV